MTTAPIEKELTKRCYSRHPAPVAVVAAVIDGTTHAMVCTSLNAVSLSPPIMSLAVRKESATWASLATASALGISVLSDLQVDIARQIADSPAAHRLSDVPLTVAPDRSAVYVDGAALRYHCRIATTSDVGDHWLVTLPVIALASYDDAAPMTFPRHYRAAAPANLRSSPLRSESR
jgi:flavin reductase (DIM6/NTAB) family NADH-FMN oxidoreductase RutF